MKPILIAATTLIASPALAHVDAAPHVHGADPSWISLLVSGLIIVGAATMAAVGGK